MGRAPSAVKRTSEPAGARGRSAWATTARTIPWPAHHATPATAAASSPPGSPITVTRWRAPQARTSSADDTTTTGSGPAAARTWSAMRSASSVRGASSSVSERRALPTANARMGITTPARATREGSATMRLRMLPSVDAMYVVARSLLWPRLRFGSRWTMEGAQTIPVTGPVILASNHVSYLDPLVLAYLADQRKRRVRFLAKAELFDKQPLGAILKGAHQIPVK